MKSFFKYVLATIIGIFGFFMIIGLAFFLFMGISSLFTPDKEILPKNGILEITLNEPVFENANEANTGFFSEPEKNVYYRDILKSIAQAKEDDHIKGISLKLSFLASGTTQANDIRNALEDFKKSGKFVYAYGNMMTQKAYYIASVADSLFLNPMGGIELKGLVSETLFFKNFGEKYGINFQVIRHGKYKSAVEPFIRTDLSEENREQISEIINPVWDNLASEMSQSRKLNLEKFNVITDSLYGLTADGAKQHQLVDAIMHESEYSNILKNKVGLEEDEDLDLISLNQYSDHLDKKTHADKVAVIYALGNIIDGDSDEGIAAEPYKKLIRKLAEDDNIKAVVLRVNSGGGSANASDEILYELQKLNEKKPLVTSFGDVAASGGYYIALGGRKIYAEANTITGSIGVLGILPSFQDLSNNIGITTDHVSTNTNSLIYSPLVDLTPNGKTVITQGVEMIYQRFINHVAKSRKMPVSQVDSLGQGRVWLGQVAVKNGLVDELGTLENAIAYAAKLAELEEYQVSSYPRAKDPLTEIMKQLNNVTSADYHLKNQLNEREYALFERIQYIQNQKGILMYNPFEFIF